jgi:hypothetical protein
MRATLTRIKAIFSANINYFVTASVVAGVAFSVGLWASERFNWLEDEVISQDVWLIVFFASIFILPLYGYLTFHVSRLSSGLQTTGLDTKVMKKSIFIYSGILWASTAWLIISLILNDVNFLLYSTSAVVVMSWYGIVKLLVRYGFTL